MLSATAEHAAARFEQTTIAQLLATSGAAGLSTVEANR
jgi:hypothetical protein